MTLTAAQKRVIVGMLKGEPTGDGHGWTSRHMRLGYYYPGPGLIVSTTPKVFAALHELHLIEPDIATSVNSNDTTWRLTAGGRTVARAAQYGGRKFPAVR